MNASAAVREPVDRAGYDDDFFLWTQEQAALLRARNDPDADWANLAEEIESLGKSERRELRSRITVLLMHLLKWQIQTAFRSPSWQATINVQRRDIERLLEESPSLRREVTPMCAAAHRSAVLKAVTDTGLPVAAFPRDLPFQAADVMAEGWFPGSASGLDFVETGAN